MKTKMKKGFFAGILGGIALVFGLLVIGCPAVEPEPEGCGETYNAATETGRSYQTILLLTVDAVINSVEKVIEYDDSVAAQLSARSLGQESLDLGDIYAMADMSKSKGNKARTLGADTGVTLEDELTAIAANFEKAVAALAPADLDFLNGLDGVTVENGLVYIDDDLVIDPTSTSGILQLSLIQAQVAGGDIDTIIADMEKIAGNYEAGDNTARGVYKTSTSRWPSKTVSYMWGNVSDYSKSLFQDAIEDWTSKIPGLTFVDRTNDHSYIARATLGNVPLVVLQSIPGFPDRGSAHVGGTYGKYTCTIRDGLSNTPGENWATRTPRHELGHTLGLEHEHQRWDRDTYLKFDASVLSDTTNWGKINRSVSTAIYGWYMDYFTIWVPFFYVRVYYPAYGKTGTNTQILADGTAILSLRRNCSNYPQITQITQIF